MSGEVPHKAPRQVITGDTEIQSIRLAQTHYERPTSQIVHRLFPARVRTAADHRGFEYSSWFPFAPGNRRDSLCKVGRPGAQLISSSQSVHRYQSRNVQCTFKCAFNVSSRPPAVRPPARKSPASTVSCLLWTPETIKFFFPSFDAVTHSSSVSRLSTRRRHSRSHPPKKVARREDRREG